MGTHWTTQIFIWNLFSYALWSRQFFLYAYLIILMLLLNHCYFYPLIWKITYIMHQILMYIQICFCTLICFTDTFVLPWANIPCFKVLFIQLVRQFLHDFSSFPSFFLSFFPFLTALQGLRDLTSPIRDWTQPWQ